MIGALGDPYSAYLTSEEYRQSLLGISGQFEGIGAELATEGPDGAKAARRSVPSAASSSPSPSRVRQRRRPASARATSSFPSTTRRSTA